MSKPKTLAQAKKAYEGTAKDKKEDLKGAKKLLKGRK